MFPTKGQNFLKVFKHIHNASAQLDGGKVLKQQLKLGPASSFKSHLIHQADIDVRQTDDSDFYETDSDQDDPDPFPSRDVDGGDILKFSPTSNFLRFTHTVTMKDHETDDTGLHNDDICGNVGMNVIDDLEVCTATEQQILGDKTFGRDIHNCEIESNQLADFDSELIDLNHDGQSHNDNHEIELNQSADFDSESIDLSHDGQSRNDNREIKSNQLDDFDSK